MKAVCIHSYALQGRRRGARSPGSRPEWSIRGIHGSGGIAAGEKTAGRRSHPRSLPSPGGDDGIAGTSRCGAGQTQTPGPHSLRDGRPGKLRGAICQVERRLRNRHMLHCQLGVCEESRSADEVIDGQQSDLIHMRNVDAPLDTLGEEIQERSWKLIQPLGVLMSIVSRPSVVMPESLQVRQAFCRSETRCDGVDRHGQTGKRRKIRSEVQTALPRAEARQAPELNITGHARAKIVLRVSPNCQERR